MAAAIWAVNFLYCLHFQTPGCNYFLFEKTASETSKNFDFSQLNKLY
ncbi:hypothetical protein GXM_03157 [Nostoc sphaeroides CCNUC1]|uniref:Uncharacterized protein n=1 Tax=Nostoc sphaeroides CCNUC1 TaxID=2653204 RepID=A0A5P8VZ49_9NOSO|nr:hypothetical protein GXM_03157 [Nostoc sphaeroides CCNUC1]